jgi:DNA-binding LacI/PurR family transcriptional regulator
MKTVSNVINDYPYVSTATRAKVEQAIAQVGYRPNLSARNLARGRAGVIALVLPQLEMPYFASLAGELTAAAEEHGSTVLIRQSHAEADVEAAAIAGQLPQRVDGVVFAPRALDAARIRERPGDLPLVVLSDADLGEGICQVGIDNVAAGRDAAFHLADVGCRRVAMIGAVPGTGLDPRAEGFVQGLQEAGLPMVGQLVRSVAENSGTEGERATAELLEDADPPDGLFAATDWVAMGAIRALHHHGLRVPEDVAVMGFDDIPYARDLSPSLTSVSPDRRQIAQLAWDLLDEQSASASAADGRRIVAHRIVERESTRRGGDSRSRKIDT